MSNEARQCHSYHYPELLPLEVIQSLGCRGTARDVESLTLGKVSESAQLRLIVFDDQQARESLAFR